MLGAAAAVVGVSGAWGEEQSTTPYAPYTEQKFPRNVYWGDLHIHSNLSPDSYGFGNTTLTPSDAYRFAQGEAVEVGSGQVAQLRRPLDFLLVSDHAEFTGVFARLDVKDPELMKTTLGQRWTKFRADGEGGRAVQEFAAAIQNPNYEQELPESFRRTVWQDAADAADAANQPGVFTAFVGYEWTAMVNGNNLHRVVLFREGADVAATQAPFSSLDSQDPEDLWQWMADYEQRTGGEVLAIPHNGNLSNGIMFATTTLDGKPLTTDYAQRRITWEPLYEVTQVKGDAEAHPLSSPDDAFADFENWDADNIGRVQGKEPWMVKHEYARPVLQLGMQLEQQLGVNPFAFGLMGSTDSHTPLATADDDNFWGKFRDSGPSPERSTNQMGGALWSNWRLAASGYSGVWAHDNTRESLYAALQRKEVYATTGPRITLRVFGGWQFEEQDAWAADLAAVGYAGGVPMGGDLSAATAGQSPRLLISALRDPEGANLDRVQVVKSWLTEAGETREQIFDVAWSNGRVPNADGELPAVPSTVNADKATYTNRYGAAELNVVWQDPDFDPALSAVYYVRVLEIPTPRWTTYDAARFGLQLDPAIPREIQERAYSSPIWYRPR